MKKRKTYKQSNIYAYVFAVEFPLDDGKPAWHCSDLAFVFHNTDKVPVANMPGVTDKLEEKMCKAWVNFAKQEFHSLMKRLLGRPVQKKQKIIWLSTMINGR